MPEGGTCESEDFEGETCAEPAVGIGSRRADRQLSCDRHLAQTARAFLEAEDRPGAQVTLNPAPQG